MKVSEIMTRDPQTAQFDSTLEEVATLMKDQDVGAIPVIDEENELAGVITDRDIVVRCIAEGKDPSDTTVEEVFSEDLSTIGPEAEVEEAAHLMAEKQVRRLPVVEDGKLIGMISIGDISVKHDERESGKALQEISQGVKQNSASNGKKRSRQGAQTSEAKSRGNVQSGGTRAENAVAKEFEENEEYDLEFSDEDMNAISGSEAEQGRQGANMKSARGRQTGSARGRDTSASKRQPNPGTLPSAKDQHNMKSGMEGSRRSEANAGKRSPQGITSRSSREESKRQGRVVSIRDDAKAGSSRRRATASRRKTG